MSNCTDGLFQARYFLLFARETGSKFFPKTVPQCNSTQHRPSLVHSLDRPLPSSFNSHFQNEAKKMQCPYVTITKGAFQKSELAGRTMAGPNILAVKYAFSKKFC